MSDFAEETKTILELRTKGCGYLWENPELTYIRYERQAPGFTVCLLEVEVKAWGDGSILIEAQGIGASKRCFALDEEMPMAGRAHACRRAVASAYREWLRLSGAESPEMPSLENQKLIHVIKRGEV